MVLAQVTFHAVKYPPLRGISNSSTWCPSSCPSCFSDISNFSTLHSQFWGPSALKNISFSINKWEKNVSILRLCLTPTLGDWIDLTHMGLCWGWKIPHHLPKFEFRYLHFYPSHLIVHLFLGYQPLQDLQAYKILTPCHLPAILLFPQSPSRQFRVCCSLLYLAPSMYLHLHWPLPPLVFTDWTPCLV